MFNLIPTPYRVYFWLAVAILVAASGAWVDHKLTVDYYKQKVAVAEVALARLEVDLSKAKARAAEFEAAYRNTASAVVAQNKAVDVWKAEAARRGKLADAAVQKAAAHRAEAQKQAGRLRSMILPKTECEALAALIDTASRGGIQ